MKEEGDTNTKCRESQLFQPTTVCILPAKKGSPVAESCALLGRSFAVCGRRAAVGMLSCLGGCVTWKLGRGKWGVAQPWNVLFKMEEVICMSYNICIYYIYYIYYNIYLILCPFVSATFAIHSDLTGQTHAISFFHVAWFPGLQKDD